MDKETLSNYGWIVICVLVLAVMIALATPFGNYIKGAFNSTVNGLFDTQQSAMSTVLDDFTNPYQDVKLVPIQGKFLSTTGVILTYGVDGAAGNYSTGGYFDYIEVVPGASVKYIGYTTLQIHLGAVLDKNKVMIQYLDAPDENMGECTMVMPENAKYIVLNYATTDTSKYYVKIKQPLTGDNDTESAGPTLKYGHSITKPLKSGSIISFGDSITVGVASSPTGNVGTSSYMLRFVNKLGNGTTYKNEAASGTYICDSESPNSIYNKVMNMTNSYDNIFIAGGVNDYAFNKPLGALGDTSTTTFYGCLYNMCEYLKVNHPDSTVFFITPFAAHRYKGNELFANVNPYRDAIYEVATQYGFNVIDGSQLGLDGNVSDEFKEQYIYDDYHPTVAGHELVAENLFQLLK